MSGTAEVYAALKARLVAASPGAALPAASVAWENKKFTPGSARWYRASFLPGQPRAAGIGEVAPNRHVGVFQVDTFDPPDKGDGPTTTEAERIAKAFARGTILTYSGVSVFIEGAYVSRIGVQPDPAWFQVPVKVFWRADVSN
jgi:hypothetical protein